MNQALMCVTECKVIITVEPYCFVNGIMDPIHSHMEKVKMANEY